MKLNNINLLFFLILIGIFSCKEEYVDPELFGNIQGQVLNEKDLTPVENAIVQISPTQTSVFTDKEGKFSLNNVQAGSYTLEIRKVEYDKELISIEVLSKKDLQLNIMLSPAQSSNNPPSNPTEPLPSDLSTNQPTQIQLKWESFDEDDADGLSYTVYFFKQGVSPQAPIAEGITDTLLEIDELEYGVTYHWQVVVSDGEALPVFGPVWTFSTAAFPEHRIRWIRKVHNKFQIFCSDGNGSILQLSHGSTGCWRPKLSPDRQQLAFLSNDGIVTHLFIMDTDGKNVQQLSTIPVAGVDMLGMDFCWSPNSARLLYANNDKLFSIYRDGSDLQIVAEAPPGWQFASVDWSETANIKVVKLTGNNVYQSEIQLIDAIGNFSLLVGDEAGKTGNPVFSLDGSKILYTHDVAGYENVNGRQLDSHIFLLDISSGQVTDLSVGKPPGTNDLDPSFSPTGSEVIFTNTPNDEISTKHLYKVGLNGLNREMIIENAEMGNWY